MVTTYQKLQHFIYSKSKTQTWQNLEHYSFPALQVPASPLGNANLVWLYGISHLRLDMYSRRFSRSKNSNWLWKSPRRRSTQRGEIKKPLHSGL